MPSKKDDKKEIKVVAKLRVEWPGDSKVVKTFDVAWHEVIAAPMPARTIFLGIDRIDA